VPVYASLEDAIAARNPVQYIEAGELRFVSYIDEANTNDSPKPDYFQLRSGVWISAQDVAQRERALIRYQGLSFTATPENDFGWILPLQAYVETKRTPGTAQRDYTGRQLVEYSIVQIYAAQVVDGVEWYLVGPDEWIEQRQIGRVSPMKSAPEGVNNGRWIEVNLFEQTLAVYDQNQLVFATLIASGVEPFYTRPGLFPIYKKLETTPMRGAFEADRSDFYYLEDVPWTMYFDEARALHAAYWRTRFGFAQSHGCVNLSPGDAHWLFDWAQEGDWVYVWDPSGQTPTDPAYYTAGGA
jgi:lipoprotein-anchoring transpeptidase ErfK/SrfK